MQEGERAVDGERQVRDGNNNKVKIPIGMREGKQNRSGIGPEDDFKFKLNQRAGYQFCKLMDSPYNRADNCAAGRRRPVLPARRKHSGRL